ncbi:hypothetical protein [Lacticaseibacillus sp. GG6-2]
MKTKFLMPLTGATLGGLSVLAQHYYWHEWLPNHRFARLEATMKVRGQCSGGWIDHRPIEVSRGDVLASGYVGGMTIDQQTYAFTLAADGTLLRWDAI